MSRSKYSDWWKLRQPSKMKTAWRREFRVRSNRALRRCQDWDVLQLPKHMWEETSLCEWY